MVVITPKSDSEHEKLFVLHYSFTVTTTKGLKLLTWANCILFHLSPAIPSRVVL